MPGSMKRLKLDWRAFTADPTVRHGFRVHVKDGRRSIADRSECGLSGPIGSAIPVATKCPNCTFTNRRNRR